MKSLSRKSLQKTKRFEKAFGKSFKTQNKEGPDCRNAEDLLGMSDTEKITGAAILTEMYLNF
jgi:hypothetical protein